LNFILQIVPASAIPDGWMGLDIGPDSIKTFNEALETTKTVIWNGPMGVFEFEKFAAGTEVILCSIFHFCRNVYLVIQDSYLELILDPTGMYQLGA
jgi:3-phosphoglycerate kinase